MHLPLEKIAEILNQSLEVDVAYYFGSFAEGKAGPNSDLDLAVLCKGGKEPPLEERLALRDVLADLCGRDVDLLILNDAGFVVAMQVVTKGKVFFESNPCAHALYAMHLFSRYAEFKELIKPMEDNILERKYYD